MSRGRPALCAARLRKGFLALLLIGAACGGEEVRTCSGSGDPEELRGSFCEGAEIRWNAIELAFQPMSRALRIRYVLLEDERVSPRLQIQLVEGPGASLSVGAPFPLGGSEGRVQRWPEGGRDPQDLTDRLEPSSNLVFDSLELREGGTASGRFNMLFDNGRTLSGAFSGTLAVPLAGG